MQYPFKILLSLRNGDGYFLAARLKQRRYCRFSIFVSSERDSMEKNSEELQKVLKVAFIGVPNVGKSTLINQIMGRSIFAMSRKVHTTRCCARAVKIVDKTQLVFLDTPGIVSAKDGIRHHLDTSCLVDGENAVQEADVVGVIHDASNKYTKFRLDPKILRLLYLYPAKHTFLILNKIDAMKTRLDLLDCARILTNKNETLKSENSHSFSQSLSETALQEIVNEEVGWSHFKDVFMVSGLTGNGVGDILIYLTKLAKPGNWIFPQNVITDQNDVKIIENAVFSKLLDNLHYDVPYNLKVQLEYFDVGDDGSVTAIVNIAGKNKKICSLLIGSRGRKIQKIAQEVEQNLKQFYLNDVRIKLVPKDFSTMNLTSTKEEILPYS